MLDLDRGVIQAELRMQALLDGLDHLISVLVLLDAGMQRHHAPLLGDRPHMQMMHADDAGDIGDEVRADMARVELRRRAFEQDVARLPRPPASRS